MSRLLHWYHFFTFSIWKIGFLPTCRSWLIARLGISKIDQDDFDQHYGTDTGGTLTPSEVELTGDDAEQASSYTPISSVDFHRMMEDAGLSREAVSNYTFIDIGSGKGRALFLAATYPFKCVVGVEMSEVLHVAAERNTNIFEKNAPDSAPIELYCQDAVTFEYPPDPLVVFFFHPFDASVMERVMDNLGQTLHNMPRPTYLLYNRGINLPPYPASLMERGGLFHCISERPPNPWKGQTGWYVYGHNVNTR